MLVPGSEFLSSIILKSKKKSITTDKRTSTMADNTSGNQQEDYLDKGTLSSPRPISHRLSGSVSYLGKY